jgi:hypothetical protein
MQLAVRTTGGFAPVPGLSRPVSMETEEMGEEGRRIEELMEEARFFELPPRLEAADPRARDGRCYEITAAAGTRREHTVVCREPVGENPVGSDEALRELVSTLSRLSRRRLVEGAV